VEASFNFLLDMIKLFFRTVFSMCLMLAMGQGIHAQQGAKVSQQVAEICKMVDLNESQIMLINGMSAIFETEMDSALYKITDKKEASKLIFEAKKRFNEGWMNLLSEKQRVEYVRNSSYSEIMNKVSDKVDALREDPKYSEADLQKFTQEIFEYLMLEKIVYVTDKYNIGRQKENIAQLKKLEPASLKEADAFKKAKHQGVVFQNGFKW
jgi:hypothetical protein